MKMFDSQESDLLRDFLTENRDAFEAYAVENGFDIDLVKQIYQELTGYRHARA